MIKKSLKGFFEKIILGYEVNNYFFSQSGEDAILQNIFQKKLLKKEKGFFVDVGAFHPYKHSNTYLFYKNGWNGINIDARPGSMKLFNSMRDRDVNLEVGVGTEEGRLKYYMLNESYATMNTFSYKNLEELGMSKHIEQEVSVEVLPLEKILDTHAARFDKIDLMSVDVEGLDLDVLKSNNWKKYKPSVIVVEVDVENIKDLFEHSTISYLMELDYVAVAKTVLLKNVASIILVQQDFVY